MKNKKISDNRFYKGDIIIYKNVMYSYGSNLSPDIIDNVTQMPKSPYNEENIFDFGEGARFKIYYFLKNDKFYLMDPSIDISNKPLITYYNTWPYSSPIRIDSVVNGEITWESDPKPDILNQGYGTTEGDLIINCCYLFNHLL